MGVRIHRSAIVESGAELGNDVEIGPLCFVGRDVQVGDGTRLIGHATLLGPARIGHRCRVFPYATLGGEPQDRSYAGERTTLEIGDDNTFREQVTVHRGTEKGDGVTRIGSRCLLMVGAHVAHDCRLGDDVVLTNLTALGGHVTVEGNVVCGGQVAVAPFVHLGRGCFLAGGAKVERDVPPFVIAAGDRARVRALNRVGLERMGVAAASRRALERAFRVLWRSGEPISRGLSVLRCEAELDSEVAYLLTFLEARL
jgi:UDP-N-acetylglucosamine acyltransferase